MPARSGLPHLMRLTAFNGVAALATGPGVPAWTELRLLLVGGFAATGQTLLLLATTVAPTNRIGPTQYTTWATLIGAFAFGEYPDGIAILGLAIVVSAGVRMLVSEPRRLRARLRSWLDRL